MFWLACSLIGFLAGTMGGLLGVGGGVIMVPAFIRFLGLSAHQAIGTSMAVIFFTAISATTKHYQLGNVELRIVVLVALLSVLGAWCGATLAGRLPERTLRMVFAGFLMVMSVEMFTRAWSLPPAGGAAAARSVEP